MQEKLNELIALQQIERFSRLEMEIMDVAIKFRESVDELRNQLKEIYNISFLDESAPPSLIFAALKACNELADKGLKL